MTANMKITRAEDLRTSAEFFAANFVPVAQLLSFRELHVLAESNLKFLQTSLKPLT
jgi:hypothetical protein